MIELQKLNNQDLNLVHSLLSKENSNCIEIAVPKQSTLYFNENESVAFDYIRAAYVGQKLQSACAEKIKYNFIQIDVHSSFIFEIVATDLQKLSQVVLEVSYGFGNENDDGENAFSFNEDIWQFFDDKDKLTIACPDLIETYISLMPEIEDSESEDI